ncbi:hypothetical protein FISHEDRAFT_68088 [Fistulina hepatica ATCC 64428]|nr:hypothetical protein FISHEDRAFT_68088 [Fistulina hepatica ATCC 64428]
MATFTPTQGELAFVSQLLAQGDPQKLGVLTGDVAVRILGGAKLPPTILGEIWAIADDGEKGWLSKKDIAIAIRLIGWAQKGETITSALVNKPGPLPVIEGITVVAQHDTGMSGPRSPTATGNLPPLTPQDKAKFHNMFLKSGPVNGLLSGPRARDIFLKSKLSTEKLLQVWNLADTQDRGVLDQTDFTIGMYLIQGLMSDQLSLVPSSLPPTLYQQAGGQPVASHGTGSSSVYTPLSGSFATVPSHVSSQYTGQSVQRADMTGTGSARQPPQLPVRPSAASAFFAQQTWDVTPAEKASSDKFFDTLDTHKYGYIEGDVAVPFLLESKLPSDELAQVWDLSDLNKDGRLTRDGFAVAMHLIQQRLAGKQLPKALSPTLVPPSMRGPGIGAPPPAVSPPPEPAKDLLSLWDETPTETTAPVLQPHRTGSVMTSQPTGGASGIMQPQQAGGAAGIMQTHYTGTPTGFTQPQQMGVVSPDQRNVSQDPFSAQSPGSKDLLSDDDDMTTQKNIHDQAVEIGNLRNNLASTNKSLEITKNERVSLEATLVNQAAQLSALQTQLSSAKAAYETETKLLDALRERYTTQSAEISKTREELIHAESDLSGLRVEKAEVEGAFLRDKEDARSLHNQMLEAGKQIEALRVEVEKLKKEAKQQKGLLAIAKKQLSTKEAEHARVQKEHEEAAAEVAAITQEREAVETSIARLDESVFAVSAALPPPVERTFSSNSVIAAASIPLPFTPEIGSPVTPAGSIKSNNPFERLALGNSMSRTGSPSVAETVSAPPPFAASNTITAVPTNPFGFALSLGEPAAPSVPVEHAVNGVSTVDTDEAAVTPDTAGTFATAPATAIPSEALAVDATVPAAAIVGLTTAPESAEPQVASEHAIDADLSAHIRELDTDETDSSDEEDEVPLAELTPKLNESKKASMSQKTANGTAAPVPFDDIFGESTSPAQFLTDAAKSTEAKPAGAAATILEQPSNGSARAATGISAFDGNFASPFEVSEPTPAPAPVPTATSLPTAGVGAFDEAFGKLSSTAQATHVSFDAAFEDNFDFASASASAMDDPLVKGQTTSVTQLTTPSKLNDVLSVPVVNGGGLASSLVAARPVSMFVGSGMSANTDLAAKPPSRPSSAVPLEKTTAFDKAFSGFDAGPSLSLDTSFAAPQPATEDHETYSTLVQSPMEFPSTRPSQTSPNGKKFFSPVPEGSPPPARMASPKPRLSSSSSKDGHDQQKSPAPRHSKLSIRLPFGKRRKQQHHEVSIPPPTQLLPPREEPAPGTLTPASDDDAAPVKQLTAMGFSRTQAVAALENSGYDMSKALNSLLGSQ